MLTYLAMPTDPIKWPHQALRQSHLPSLAMLAHHTWHHQEVRPRLMKPEHMALTWILTGKRTKIISATRRSTAWRFLGRFVRQLSVKSWTSKDVIHYNYRWQLCCISKPTTFGCASWLMVVNCTWFRLGTSQLWYSPRNYSLSCATKELTSTRCAHQKQDKTASFWTRRRTPSTQHNKLQISSVAGSLALPVQLILRHNTSWHSYVANWHSFVKNWETMQPHQPLQVPQDRLLSALRLHPFKLHSWELRIAQHLLLHPVLIHPPCLLVLPHSIRGFPRICQQPLRDERSTNGSKIFSCLIRRRKSSWTTSQKRKSGGKINLQRRLKPWHSGHRPHQLTSSSTSEKAQAQGASIPFTYPPCDDSRHLPFDSLHDDSQHSSFSGLPHHPNTHDAPSNPSRSPT